MNGQTMHRVVLLNDTRVDCHYGCELVVSNLHALCARYGMRVVRTFGKFEFTGLLQNTAWLNNCDLVLINGEGTIHHNAHTGGLLLQLAALAQAQGKPVALINCSWQGNGQDFMQIAHGLPVVSVRESLSEAEFTAQGGSCRRVPDLTLWNARQHPHGMSGSYSDYLARAGKGTQFKMGYTDSVSVRMALELHAFGRQQGAQLVAIRFAEPRFPRAFWFVRSLIEKKDLKQPGLLLRKVGYGSFHYQQIVHSLPDFLQQVSSLDLLVSARFHAATIALSVGTPFSGSSAGAKSHLHRWPQVKGFAQGCGLKPRSPGRKYGRLAR
ncbi:MAG: polysaccharide pyruvyl transferase family protein [Limnobacter sp.]|nr:polysaccharide pyruvyl transferase family protein [Limnobacter sp.]